MALLKELTLAANESTKAIKLITDYTSSPMLGDIILKKIEKYTESKQANVSKKLLINVGGGRQVINDNIAPGLREWNLTVYIEGEAYEFSNKYVPSLKNKKKKLDDMFYSRSSVRFKDKDNFYFNVGIEELKIDEEADRQGKLKVDIKLTELADLEAEESYFDTTSMKTSASSGTNDGTSQDLGSTQSSKAFDSKIYKATQGDVKAIIPGFQ